MKWTLREYDCTVHDMCPGHVDVWYYTTSAEPAHELLTVPATKGSAEHAQLAAAVRAVNAHDALVAACEAIVRDADSGETEAEEMGWSAVEIFRSNIDKARAALEKARTQCP